MTSYIALLFRFSALFLTVLFIQFYTTPNAAADKKDKESVYERVIRTGTIRCGYAIWPPYIDKDLVTGEMKGVFYDYVNELGKTLELNIEWTEETSYANYVAGLNSNRFDAMCAGVWPVGAIMKAVDFSNPPYYHPIGTYVRADDNRFDENLFEVVNSPDIRISNIDGFIPGIIARAHFPEASVVALPDLSGIPQMLMNVAHNKADITFTDPSAAHRYMASNPGKLKKIPLTPPIRTYGNTMAIKKGEQEFLNMLNYANEELLNSGKVKEIVGHYPEVSPHLVFHDSHTH